MEMSKHPESYEEPSLPKRAKNNVETDTNGSSPCLGGDVYDLLTNRIDKNDSKLFDFVRWCVDLSPKFTINKKIYMGIKGSIANYGMIAVEDIELGEELFRIPVQRTLSWENLRNADKLRPEIEKMAVASRWTPIILAIMLEDGVENSSWSEYLRLFLRSNELTIPLLWEEDAFGQYVQGLNISHRVRKDRAQIESDFRSYVFPTLMRELQLNESVYDVLLKQAYRVSAFVMSYSFTRPQSDEQADNQENSLGDDSDDDDQEATSVGNALTEVPLMIPVADFLNASVHKNNARLHWNEGDGTFLSMICTKPIPAGEEVFNTYGEISSEEMLYLYGYVEDGPINPHEEIFIPSKYLKDVVYSAVTVEGARANDRWQYLINRKIVGPELPIVIGVKGVLTDDDLHEAIRVMTLTNEQFDEMAEEEDAADCEPIKEGLYSKDNLKALPTAVKLIVKLLIQKKLADYPERQEEYEAAVNRDRELLRNDIGEDMARRGINVVLARRAFYLAYVKMRQMEILNNYLLELV